MTTLEWIVYLFDLLPIVVSLYLLVLSKRIGKLIWVILFYNFCSLLNNTIINYSNYHHISYFFYLYLFTIVEYSCFAIFIYSVIQNKYLKKSLIACSVLFICFCLFNIFFQPKYSFDSLQTSIEALILLIFCILFLFEQINKPEVVFIYSSYKFWVITGILIYLACTFFLFVFAASLPQKEADQYWFINSYSNILRNIFFTIAILVYAKSPKTPLPPTSMEPDYQPFLN